MIGSSATLKNIWSCPWKVIITLIPFAWFISIIIEISSIGFITVGSLNKGPFPKIKQNLKLFLNGTLYVIQIKLNLAKHDWDFLVFLSLIGFNSGFSIKETCRFLQQKTIFLKNIESFLLVHVSRILSNFTFTSFTFFKIDNFIFNFWIVISALKPL